MKTYLSAKNTALLTVSLLLAITVVSCSDFNSANSKDGIKSIKDFANTAQKSVAQESLFTLVTKNSHQLAKGQKDQLSTVQKRSSTAKVHVGKLAENPSSKLQKGQAILFPVAPDKKFIVVGKKLKHLPTHDIFWAGSLKNKNGNVQLVLTEKGITGTIRTDSTLYSLEPIGNGLEAISLTDQSFVTTDSSPEHPSGALIDTASAWPVSVAKQAGKRVNIKPNATNNDTVDVLVVYTPNAEQASGDINGLIQDAVEQTNNTFETDGLPTRLRLKHTANIHHNVDGASSYDQVINEMEDPSDGIMDNIQSLRDQYVADIVVLVDNLKLGSTVGAADAILAASTNAFAAVYYDAATKHFGFAHEVGHLFGARHEMSNDPQTEPFKFGHAYIDKYKNTGLVFFKTIMVSHADNNTIGYWSSPYYSHDGDPMGTTEYANNVRVIRFTTNHMRDLNTDVTIPSNFTLTNKYATGDYPHFTWADGPNAESYNIYRCLETVEFQQCNDQSNYFYKVAIVGGNTDEWTDGGVGDGSGVTIVQPLPGPGCTGDDKKVAIYYIKAQDRTGESYRSDKIFECVEQDSQY